MAAPPLTPARLTRLGVATALAAGAVTTVVSIATMPDLAGDHAERLRAIGAAPATATLSALTWVAAQLFVGVGAVGVAHLLRNRVPVLALVAGALVGLQAFGHAVYGGVNLVMLSMARDLGSVDTHAAVLTDVESGTALPFMALGLIGTVLGMLVLAAALWRGRLGPRWVGPAIVAWIVVEFAGSAVSEWSTYLSGLLYLVIFGTLAVVVHRSSVGHWETAVEATAPSPERVVV
ncbi:MULTISPECIES: hypothetical protein [unclassified Ornithinimicrobium]|uniref:hypothetical protein n=1 Tax=unclassified Ornithinimicrobium TaxID=2615080 RepID=UPI003854AF89